jgi:hypothetical protein
MKTLLLGFLLVGSACAQVAETGPARAERLLAAMGGRAAWAQVKFAYVEAVHDTVTLPAPYTNRIWNDFTAPRVRLEATNPQIDRRRVIDNGKGRLSREGVVTELTPEQIEDERRWWEANIYRTLHRLAVNDPDLTARAVGDNRLELFRADGKRLNWFVLTPRGEPMLFGTWDSENGSAFGPLARNGSINYPKWGAVPAGLWRYEIVKIVTSATVPADVSFTTP